METQPAPMPPISLAPLTHRIGRVLVASWFIFYFGLGPACVCAGMLAYRGSPQFQYTTPARTLLVMGFSIWGLSGLLFAAWGFLQALYPAMFVPTVRPVYDGMEGTWIQVHGPGSTPITVRSVFNVCRHLRLWGMYAIPLGVGWGVDMLALAITFKQNELPSLSSYGPPFVIACLLFLCVLPAEQDVCRDRRVGDQTRAEN